MTIRIKIKKSDPSRIVLLQKILPISRLALLSSTVAESSLN